MEEFQHVAMTTAHHFHLWEPLTHHHYITLYSQ